MSASCVPDLNQSKLVLLLLGGRQTGKSSVGDTILGRRVFQTTKGTASSSKEKGSVFGRQVTIVDTPGWPSWLSSPDTISQELSRGLALCRPEPHAILLVVSTTSTFSQDEWKAMEVHLRLLQTPIWQRAIVLFTHGDKLGHLPIQEHIRRQGRSLQWLVERCGNRYHVVASQSRAPAGQVKELLEKIDKMVEANMRPREIQQRMYTQIRKDVRKEEERKVQIEMSVMQDGMRRQVWMASGPTYLPRGFLTDPAASKPDLGLILLGRRKSGKSSVGNIILGRGQFQSGRKTVTCAVGHRRMSGLSVTVVDTPGWSLFGLAQPEQVRLEIGRSPSLCPPRSKVTFLLAIPVDSFRERDRKAVEKYLSVLGDGVWRNTVVLFTYGCELRGKTIKKHIEEKGRPLQWLVERCGHMHYIFDKNTDQTEVSRVLEMVEQL
ncbi:GTPase IMAP family member 8-like [Polymixia lowei]